MVGGSEYPASGLAHRRLFLYEVHGADFVYFGDAGSGGGHGFFAGGWGNLWSDCIFGFAAHARDRDSHGAGGAAEDAGGDVRAAGIVADGSGDFVRVGDGVWGDAVDVVTAF